MGCWSLGRRVVPVGVWKHVVVHGPNDKEIAAIMHVSISTLHKWRDRICDRYGPDGKTAVALWAKQNGFG